MGVMVEGGNFFDLRQESLVYLLHIGTGKRSSLGGGEGGVADGSNQEQSSKSESHTKFSGATKARIHCWLFRLTGLYTSRRRRGRSGRSRKTRAPTPAIRRSRPVRAARPSA